MKRMYAVLGIMLLALVWAFSSLGQKEPDSRKPINDPFKRHMDLRDEMHRRMMESLMGDSADADMFKDLEQMFDQALRDSFSSVQSLSEISGLESNFQYEWRESKTGRTLELTPKEGQKLDFDVTSDMITIKGTTERKSPNGTFSSKFSNSFPVPDDCDGSKVKISQKANKIVLDFPYRGNTPRKEITPNKFFQSHDNEDRKPLPPSEGDIEI